MIALIRSQSLKVKEVCEAHKSPIPLKVRVWLHAIARRIYHATYGLTPAEAVAIFDGKDAPAEKILFANYCMRAFGSILNPDGTRSCHINVGDSALLAMMAFQSCGGNWRRMLEVNGIHLEKVSVFYQGDVAEYLAERCDLPKGTKFYYLEPEED